MVFDLDGVIVDSEPLQERANAEYVATLGIELERELLHAMLGRRVRELTDEIARRAGLTPEEAFSGREAVFWRLLLESPEALVPMPGLHEAVARLTAAGCRLAVASSGTRRYVEHVLERLGVRAAFAAVVSGDDVANGKPHPEIYLRAAAALGIDPASCVAIEDAPAGIAAARAAGMRVIAVPHALVAGLDVSAADAAARDLRAAAELVLSGGLTARAAPSPS